MEQVSQNAYGYTNSHESENHRATQTNKTFAKIKHHNASVLGSVRLSILRDAVKLLNHGDVETVGWVASSRYIAPLS